jgi:cytidylate kinase
MAIITISRQFGAGGRTLGNMISEKLNYNLVDEDIIEQVAQEAKVSPSWVKSIENEAGGTLLRYISGLGPFRKNYVDRLSEHKKGYIDGHIYVELLHKIITRMAEEGDIVIIGRGGQYILKNHPQAVHILMMSDMEHRISFMEKQYNLSRKQATLVVEKQSKRRKNLYRYFGREDYDDPTLYHIVLNMSKLSMDAASDVVRDLVNATKS